jgi:hypothetical protein
VPPREIQRDSPIGPAERGRPVRIDEPSPTARHQDKLDAFSTKARGMKDETPDPVVSNFRGTFTMRDGTIHFSNVTFAMPGARVSVGGRFVMESEALDFRGTVRRGLATARRRRRRR